MTLSSTSRSPEVCLFFQQKGEVDREGSLGFFSSVACL
jgi:hypothetical protein